MRQGSLGPSASSSPGGPEGGEQVSVSHCATCWGRAEKQRGPRSPEGQEGRRSSLCGPSSGPTLPPGQTDPWGSRPAVQASRKTSAQTCTKRPLPSPVGLSADPLWVRPADQGVLQPGSLVQQVGGRGRGQRPTAPSTAPWRVWVPPHPSRAGVLLHCSLASQSLVSPLHTGPLGRPSQGFCKAAHGAHPSGSLGAGERAGPGTRVCCRSTYRKGPRHALCHTPSPGKPATAPTAGRAAAPLPAPGVLRPTCWKLSSVQQS